MTANIRFSPAQLTTRRSGTRGVQPEAGDPASIDSAPASLSDFCRARGWRLRVWPWGRLGAAKHGLKVYGRTEEPDALLARLRAADRQLAAIRERGRWS